jgi:uncharacterized protein (DUF488 family)
MPLERILTIGVYGFSVEQFFAALEAATTDLFCDLRARRGVRGREYAFANATRLQRELTAGHIEYRHFPALAPTREIRGVQYQADAAADVAKRKRDQLDPAFVDRYQQLLRTPEAEADLAEIATAAAPILFCVERLPQACHRSLVAARLAEGRQISIENITP